MFNLEYKYVFLFVICRFKIYGTLKEHIPRGCPRYFTIHWNGCSYQFNLLLYIAKNQYCVFKCWNLLAFGNVSTVYTYVDQTRSWSKWRLILLRAYMFVTSMEAVYLAIAMFIKIGEYSFHNEFIWKFTKVKNMHTSVAYSCGCGSLNLPRCLQITTFTNKLSAWTIIYLILVKNEYQWFYNLLLWFFP